MADKTIRYRYGARMEGEFHLTLYDRVLIAHDGLLVFAEEPPHHVKEYLSLKGWKREGEAPQKAPEKPKAPEPQKAPAGPEKAPEGAPEASQSDSAAPKPDPKGKDLKGKGKGGKKKTRK